MPQEPSHAVSKPAFLTRWGLPVSLLFSLIVAVFVERRVFTDRHAINDDVRNQIYWMAQIMQQGLFDHDYIADYFTQPLLISPVLLGLYQLVGPWINPLALSQFLPFALVLLATGFLFQYAHRYKDASYAFWTCFAFNCSIWIFKNMAGGLSRAFMYPLLFLFLWQLSRKSWVWVTVSLILSALIYPPAFFLALILLLIEAIVYWGKDTELKPRLLSFFISLGASLGLLFWRTASADESHALFGNLSTNQSTDGLRDFYIGGRIVLFPWGNFSEIWPFPFKMLGQLLERLPHLYILIPTGAFLFLIWLYNRTLQPRWGKLLIPESIWRLLISSSILYTLAWIFLFYFYVPERYFQYTLPLIPTFMFGALLYQLHQRFIKTRPWLPIGFAALCVLITSFFWRADLMTPKASEKALFDFLKTTPDTSMIAAPPGLASNIPLYAYRSVFISNEAYIPFHQTYFRTIKGRFKSFLTAYYATNPKILADFTQTNHINYMVTQAIDFREPRLSELRQRYYFAFDTAFFEGLKQPNQQNYTLNQAPQHCILYNNRGIKVIDLRCLIKAMN